MKQQFKQLKVLTALRKDVALAGLTPVLAQERRLRASLDDLRKPCPRSQVATIAAEQSGAVEIWEAWASQRQIDLNGQLALVLAEKEALMQGAKTALARDEAMRLLAIAARKRR